MSVAIPGTELIWAWPLAWALLPLPFLVHRFAPTREAARERALRVPALEPFEAFGHIARPASGRRLRVLLLALAWIALLAATARPQGFGDPVPTPLDGRDLMLGIDISGSMRESDLYAGNRRATRMEVVRVVARDFVERRAGDRIGLIMFGDQAYVQTPLTEDHETVAHFLDEATIGLAGKERTAIGDAIGLAVKRLRSRPAESRVLILLTDGANTGGVVEPLEAARVAAAEGIRIHTIGVGGESAPGSLRDRLFGMRRAELDEATLVAVADATGGRYFRARDAAELERIYQAIDALEPTVRDGDAFRPLIERYPWPLGIALALSLAWAALGVLPSHRDRLLTEVRPGG